MKTIKYLFMILVFVVGINAQEIGIAPAKLWTNNTEIGNPYGVGFYFLQRIGKIALKLEYTTAKNERNYYGLIYGGFLIREEDFIRDNISSKSSLSSTELSIQIPQMVEIYQNYLGMGIGISSDKFTQKKAGLNTGKEFNISENKYGVSVFVSLARERLFGLPLKFTILFKQKNLIGTHYTTDSDQPFEGDISIKELKFNLGYVF